MSRFAYSQGTRYLDDCPSQHRAASWEEFAAVFDAPDILRSTAKGWRYICGPMMPGQPAGKAAVATWRCNELATPVAWIAFDFDSLDGAGDLDTLIATCRAMFRCLWHHTASSTPQRPRIRIVAPLDREATPAEIAALAAAIGPILGPQRDTNQDRTSQPLYLPLRGAQVMRCDDAPPICVDMWLPAASAVALPPPVTQEWTTEPCPEWRGPESDDALIQRALRAQSTAAAFGGRASFADLWSGNAEALGRSYPDPVRPYDASSADAALAQHLSFWTGKSCERIERLMRQSALAREKWDSHSSYLSRTILGAVGRQEEVLTDKAAAALALATAAPSGAVALQGVEMSLLQLGTQDSVAQIFARQMAGKMLFNHTRKTWLEWDGTRWQIERTGKAFDFARDLARTVNYEGKSSLGSSSFCAGVEQFAQSDRALAVEGTEFDRDNYLLNTPGGTFDLRTNEGRQHNPDDRLSLCTTVAPTREGGAAFDKFLDEITLGDRALVEFLQVSLGACLSGAVESHWLLFWTGTGRNGKNTLGELVQDAMGDYARKVPTSVLMAKKHEGHPTEIANLQGIRLALSSEINDGEHWHEARLNEVTGDGTLSGRFMGRDLFEFKRTHKHLIYGNHRPQLRAVTPALRSRIKIVPFKADFNGREDADLPQRLRENLGYVLAWLIEGHGKWLAAGKRLPPCQTVDAEIDDYFAAQSTPEMWLAERVQILAPDERNVLALPQAGVLYRDYSDWKKDRGEQPVSMVRWADALKRFEKVRSSGVRYRGLMLIPQVGNVPFPLVA